MRQLKVLWAAGIVAIAAVGCDKENEDITNGVNRNGSVETAVQVNHLDSLKDELVTTHKIWVRNDIYRIVEYRDTIPSLGMENTVAENEGGDTKNVSVKKDYEIYITVK